MKIAVIAANGRTGQFIVQEAVKRHLDVTAIARSENKTAASQFVQKDLFALTKDDIRDFDVVIDAFGVFVPERLDEHSTSLRHLADLLSGTKTRLLIVGGAGSLYINQDHTLALIDAPDFPDAYKPVASHMQQAFTELQKRHDVQWTYVSPAADFQADGARTGTYTLAGEEFTTDANGESRISYADYAIAMIDEAVNGNHLQQRISVRY